LEREREVLTRRRRELAADRQQLETQRQALQARLQELQQVLGERRRQRDQLEAAVGQSKGKVMRRLGAMSGGEKSLTALSFLFALQRFRPSPSYALDEVDSFLDGVNVENLARLIAQQARLAQFLVVSHRRPMIAVAQRTIGVTQTRGAHIQVIGLPIQAA